MKPDGTLILEQEAKNIETIISDSLYIANEAVYNLKGKRVFKIPKEALWVGDGIMIVERNHGYAVVNWDFEPVFQQYVLK